MPYHEIESNKKKIGIGFVVAFFAIWFLVSFWNEIGEVRQIAWNLLMIALRRPVVPLSSQALPALLNLTLNLVFGFGLVSALWVYLLSAQALLPVSNSMETIRTAWHLLLHVRGLHGPATFIQNGEEKVSAEEKKRAGRGVVVIDFNSAAVFEQLIGPPSLLRPLFRLQSKLLALLGLVNRPETGGGPRVHGPGIIFTSGGERMRGVIDLRKQSRFGKDVRAYTKDGIELSTGIWILFSVGHKPDVLQVTYQGYRNIENLRPVALRKSNNGKIKVETLPSYELDEADRREIHEAVSRGVIRQDFADLPAEEFLPSFDPGRVFAAVSSSARDGKNELTPWDVLPVQVATGIFRETLAKEDFDSLYQPDKKTGKYPLPQIKERFNCIVRNQGVLSYRLLFHRRENDDIFLYDGEYEPEDLRASSIRPLTGVQILRVRGIKVIACGFLDLSPVSEMVTSQRLDSWKVGWESPREFLKAEQDIEAERIRNLGHIEAESKLLEALDDVINKSSHPQEALAAYLMHKVEILTNETKGQSFLSPDTLKALDTIHNWLLPDARGKGKP